MQLINYVFVAAISAFVGMFVMAWYDLDHPVEKEAKHYTFNVENTYYVKLDENYILMPTPPYHPNFQHPKNLLKLE